MRAERPVTLVMGAFAVQVQLERGQREGGFRRLHTAIMASVL
jgi:hypothetical protein